MDQRPDEHAEKGSPKFLVIVHAHIFVTVRYVKCVGSRQVRYTTGKTA